METDLSSWKLKQLKDHLRSLGLSQAGNKSELIQRIQGRDFLTGVVDADRNILLNLNTKELLNACKTNKFTAELCADNKFLRLRLQRNYKENANEALVDAAQYGDISFVKYLVDNYEVSFSYDQYGAFLIAYIGYHDDVIRYLIENLDITEDDLLFLLNSAANELDLDLLIYIIERGIVSKLINEGKNIRNIYKKVMKVVIDEWKDAGGWPPDMLDYLNLMKHLYDNLETSTYLKVLTDLSKSKKPYRRPWT